MDLTVMHINKGNAHGTQGERSNPANSAEHRLLSWMCGADCWPVSKSGREKILASDSSSEFPRPLYLLELKKTKSEIKVEKWKKIPMLIMLMLVIILMQMQMLMLMLMLIPNRRTRLQSKTFRSFPT